MIAKERAVSILYTMMKIRHFELKALQLFEENKLRGSVHLYVGEEAVAATVCSHLKDNDYITSTHRGHGHCIAKGAELTKSMAELMGKETGYCKGRSGSMHIADFSKGNLGANAIVGGGIPIATGAAMAIKQFKTDQVAVTFFGDGASNEGVAHESMNLAAVMKLPVIFVCENNGYGISVPTWQSTSVEDISVRAAAYNMPGVTVDGNDVEAIDSAVAAAIDRAKRGEGPSLIECKTSRWLGHWTGDPQSYRPAGEIDAWKAKCPIKRWSARLVEQGILTEAEIETLEKKAMNEVEEAAAFAISSPNPDPAKVLDDVFYEEEA